MSRAVLLGVAAILLFAFGVIAANTRIVQGVIPVTSYETDVNKDTRVNVADLGLVASKYGQTAPTATPASGTIREVHISLLDFAAGIGGAGTFGDWKVVSVLPIDSDQTAIDIDGARYPQGTGFQLVARLQHPDSSICVRLFNQTVGQPVAGSEVCATNGVFLVTSTPFSIASSLDRYVVETQTLGGCCSGIIYELSLTARW